MQKRNYNTKQEGNTECDPFWNMEDIKNVVNWFENNNDWDEYLITLFELLLGRRISDTTSMKWCDIYHKNGSHKREITTVKEQKTGKTITLALSSMVFEAAEKYAEHMSINPIEHYYEDIFDHKSKRDWYNVDEVYFKNGTCEFPVEYNINTIYDWIDFFNKDWDKKRINTVLKNYEEQKAGKKKSKKFGVYDKLFDYIHYVVDYRDMKKWHTDNYRKKLKRAVEACNIKYPVSTHTMRKSFAYWIYTMHMFDPNCVYSLQKMFGHDSALQTLDYMGVAKIRNRQYIEDHGEFIRNVLAGKGDEIVKNMPVVSLKSDDLGSIFMMLLQEEGDPLEKYNKAINMANEMRVV